MVVAASGYQQQQQQRPGAAGSAYGGQQAAAAAGSASAYGSAGASSYGSSGKKVAAILSSVNELRDDGSFNYGSVLSFSFLFISIQFVSDDDDSADSRATMGSRLM